jgi:hypothetical protein
MSMFQTDSGLETNLRFSSTYEDKPPKKQSSTSLTQLAHIPTHGTTAYGQDQTAILLRLLSDGMYPSFDCTFRQRQSVRIFLRTALSSPERQAEQAINSLSPASLE